MARTTLIVLSASALLLTAVHAQQNKALDGDGVVNIAATRNRDFLALNERVRETEALLRQAGVRPFPMIETEVATGRPLGTAGEEEYSAGYFQPIETGGKRQKRTSVASFGVELARAELADRRRLLAIDVKLRYAEAVAAQRKLETLRALLQIDRDNYDLTNARVRAGDAAPLEAALFSAEAGKTRAQQATYSGRLASSLAELRRIAGVPSSEPFEIRYEFTTLQSLPDLESLKSQAKDRPDLRALRINERRIGAETELAIAEGKRDLTASARYSQRNSQFDAFGLTAGGAIVPLRDRDNILTFGLSIPLFTGSRNRGNVEASEARAAAARQKSEFLEGTIPLEIESAWQRSVAARESVQLLKGVIDQSEANIKVIREAYNLGQLRALDVLNEQRRLVDTRLSFVDAQLEAEQARIDLERAAGGPIR